MRFNKKKLMEKRVSALMAIVHIEGIDVTGLAEVTQDSLSDVIMLMAGDVRSHSGSLSSNPGPGPPAPNQDPTPGASPRILRIREQAEMA